ncbi:hepatocellular carcinoma-associated antigen [Sarcoptes scabiei]|nr:hepatocellular carcinoma-associated antigen [Sarcoptes scabiei]
MMEQEPSSSSRAFMFGQKHQLASWTLESSSNNQNDMFGANGLPLTPSSITMVGNFHSFVKSFNASIPLTPYLTKYLDFVRNKNEKLTLIFEHQASSKALNNLSIEDFDSLIKCGLYGLYHLHYVVGACHGLISPDSFIQAANCDKIRFKLAHWAINIITNLGRLCQCQFYPNDIRFISPEQCLLSPPTKKSDIWSLGLTILYLMVEKCRTKFPQNPIEWTECSSFKDIIAKLDIKSDLSVLPEKWLRFFQSTLNVDPNQRLSIKKIFCFFQISLPIHLSNYQKFLKTKLPKSKINCEKEFNASLASFGDFDGEDQCSKHSNAMNLYDFYYLWRIAYPSKEPDKDDKTTPTILSIPRLIVLENDSQSQDHCDEDVFYSNEISSDDLVQKLLKFNTIPFKTTRMPKNEDFKMLPLNVVYSRLDSLSSDLFLPLIITSDLFTESKSRHITESLPLPIRENDFDYQCERLFIFKALLNGYPFLRNQLIMESKIDICPLYRSQIWSSLLNVRWHNELIYLKIDKISKTSTDRQIAVDIPRCHQYNDFLASSEGHRKLTRILKTWLAHNESNGEVYWQGLDSLAAPFVILNFNNEPRAFACFDNFVKKYLHGFFKKDNSKTIQEYLALFQTIIAFHDPILSNHLASLKFVPDLYAISWFLTMFTHILPLHQIFQLWDTLILG